MAQVDLAGGHGCGSTHNGPVSGCLESLGTGWLFPDPFWEAEILEEEKGKAASQGLPEVLSWEQRLCRGRERRALWASHASSAQPPGAPKKKCQGQALDSRPK